MPNFIKVSLKVDRVIEIFEKIKYNNSWLYKINIKL